MRDEKAEEIAELSAHLHGQLLMAIDILDGLIQIAEMEARQHDIKVQELCFYRAELWAQATGTHFVPDDRQKAFPINGTTREPTPFGRAHNFGVP